MTWIRRIFKQKCIICGEITPYCICDKCRKAILQVRERAYPIEEQIDSSNFLTGFFTNKRKKDQNADSA